MSNNKRYFEVIINNKFQGIYSDSSPIKTARKIAKDLLGNKKSIIFYLKEKSKSKKNYGPYIGYMNNQKIVVKKYKMSGGVNDYNWSDKELQTAFLNGCNINDTPQINFAIKKINYNGQNIKLAIFGFNPIFFNEKTYLGFILYIYDNLVKIKEIIPTGSDINFESVTRDYLKKITKDDGLTLDQLLLKNFNSKNMSFGNIQKYINDNTKKSVPISPAISDSPSSNSVAIQNQKTQNSVPISPAISASPSSNPVAIQKPNTENKWNYNRNKQVTIKNDIICFGPHLFNRKYKYKYTYNKSTATFYEIDKNNKKKIEINTIPLYDLLSLYEFAKKNPDNYSHLIDQIKEKLSKEKQLEKFGKTFVKLDQSNFEKTKNNSDFGKFKKRTMGIKKVNLNSTGTTYIFFNLKNGSFQNVCFRDGEKAFYYNKENTDQKLELNKLDDIDALKNLVVYILLIRILHNKPDFAEVILNVARSNLSSKFNEFASTKSTTLNRYGYLKNNPKPTLTSVLPIS